MQHSGSTIMPAFVMITTALSLLFLALLHILSPEFEPAWRMVSEYALGEFAWVTSLFFLCWGISSILVAAKLWKLVTSKASKVGVLLLFISGVGASLAAVFDVSQPTEHGIAGLLGIPTVPVATLFITYHVSKKQAWMPYSKTLKLVAHLTWILLVLMIIAMVVMMTGFQNAGIEVGPGSPPPTHVPAGVIAVAGYVNRLLIVVDILWLIIAARAINSISKSNFNNQ